MERVISTEQALTGGNIDLFEACSLLTGTNCTTRQSGDGTTETGGNRNGQWPLGSRQGVPGDTNSSISSGSRTPWNVPMTGDEDKDETGGPLSAMRSALGKVIRGMKARAAGSRNERRDGSPRQSMFFGNRRCRVRRN